MWDEFSLWLPLYILGSIAHQHRDYLVQMRNNKNEYDMTCDAWGEPMLRYRYEQPI